MMHLKHLEEGPAHSKHSLMVLVPPWARAGRRLPCPRALAGERAGTRPHRCEVHSLALVGAALGRTAAGFLSQGDPGQTRVRLGLDWRVRGRGTHHAGGCNRWTKVTRLVALCDS